MINCWQISTEKISYVPWQEIVQMFLYMAINNYQLRKFKACKDFATSMFCLLRKSSLGPISTQALLEHFNHHWLNCWFYKKLTVSPKIEPYRSSGPDHSAQSAHSAQPHPTLTHSASGALKYPLCPNCRKLAPSPRSSSGPAAEGLEEEEEKEED